MSDAELEQVTGGGPLSIAGGIADSVIGIGFRVVGGIVGGVGGLAGAVLSGIGDVFSA